MTRPHDLDFDFNLLKAFDALMTERHLTRAAERIGLTQSGMSHALTRLREFYDDPLFVRGKGGMQPTMRALAIGDTLSTVMTAIRQEVLSQAVFDPGNAARTFTLCLTDLAEVEFLPTLGRHIQEVAPQCSLRTIQVASRYLPEVLESGAADVAIGALNNLSDRLYQQQIFSQPYVTLVSRKNTELPEELSLEQFQECQHIVVDLGDPIRSPFDHVIDAAGIRRQIFLRTPHFLSVPPMLDANPHMIATVPHALWRQSRQQGLVRKLKPPVSLPSMAVRQFWHPRFNREVANVWLRGAIKSLFTSPPPTDD